MNKIYKVAADGKVKISVNIPLKTLQRLDSARTLDKKARSSWITASILEKLAKEREDM